MITGATRLAAVIGCPVRHSLSPTLHNAAFAATGLDWVYTAFEVPAGAAADALGGMRALGISGLSVTMPHKGDVAAACDEVSDDVSLLDAANTVVPIAGGPGALRLRAESTDGAGFLDALGDNNVDVSGTRALVVGAGGAGRAVVLALARAGAREIIVVNRDSKRAAAAVALGRGAARVGHRDEAASCDLIVNATPQGMGSDTTLPIDAARLAKGQVVNDLVYHPAETPLMAAARSSQATVIGGLGMLLHQAGRQFSLWTGEAAPIEAMRAAAVRVLANRSGR